MSCCKYDLELGSQPHGVSLTVSCLHSWAALLWSVSNTLHSVGDVGSHMVLSGPVLCPRGLHQGSSRPSLLGAARGRVDAAVSRSLWSQERKVDTGHVGVK